MSYGKLIGALAIFAACAAAYAQSEPRYRAERIPTEDPTTCASAPGDVSDLNDAGAVIGRFCFGESVRAFIQYRGLIRFLPQDADGDARQLGLNDRFDYIIAVGPPGEGQRNLFVRNDGAAVQIDPLPGDFNLNLVALNNRREVLGLTVGQSHPSGRQPMLWRNGRARPLETPPDSVTSVAVSLSNTGVAIGFGSNVLPGQPSPQERAVLWEGGTVMPLPLPPKAIRARGVDINDRGDAVLSVALESGTSQAHLWRRGSFIALPLLPIGENDNSLGSGPADINNRGQVVGTTTHRNELQEELIRRATLWRGGAVYDLEKLLVDENGEAVTNLRLQGALEINDRGQILVVEFFDLSERPKYFVLTPVR